MKMTTSEFKKIYQEERRKVVNEIKAEGGKISHYSATSIDKIAMDAAKEIREKKEAES